MKQSNTIKSMLQRASVFLLAAPLATTAARAQFSGGNSESPVELILGLDGKLYKATGATAVNALRAYLWLDAFGNMADGDVNGDGTVSIADVTMLDDLEYGGTNQ